MLPPPPGGNDLNAALAQRLANAQARPSSARGNTGAGRQDKGKGPANPRPLAHEFNSSPSQRGQGDDIDDLPGSDSSGTDESESSDSEDDTTSTSSPGTTPLALKQAAALLTTSTKVLVARLPSHVHKTHELASLYCYKSLEKVNFYVDYGKIHAHVPGAQHVERLGGSGTDALFIARPAPSATIPNAHAFLIVLEKVATLTVAFYPHRRKEFDDYHRWFSGQVAHGGDDFTSYRDYDADYRRNLGGEGYGHDLNAARKDTATLL
ncbi:hypothetical protein JCM5296_005787, partial [Sporobolomyces johnsonii]